MQIKFFQYCIALITALILDGVWLGLIGKGFYKKYIGFMMSENPNLKVALLFYLIFAASIIVLVISPALAGQWSIWKVFLYGSLLGLVIYGGYDLTNQALIKNWPLTVTIVDMAWGTLMTAVVAVVTYFFAKGIK